MLGWKIRQGLKRGVTVGEMIDYIRHYAQEALFPHFDEEENQLLPFISTDDSYRVRTIEEHQKLKEIFQTLSDPRKQNEETLLSFASVLEAHIRFEERELFPYMEMLLSDEELDAIGQLITELHHPYIESYPNEFWNR
jgi:hemerythrin-like domain-containing protein